MANNNDFTTIHNKLIFISTIRKGDKVCFKTLVKVPYNSWFGSFVRYYTGESRESNLSDLNDLISDIKSVMNNLGVHYMFLLRGDIEKAIEGLKNLKFTYEDDVNFQSKLKAIIEELSSLKMSVDVKYTSLSQPIPTKNTNMHFMNFTPSSIKKEEFSDYEDISN